MIRKAEIDDVSDIMRVHVETWRRAYSGLVPDDFLTGMLDRLASEERFRFWREQILSSRSQFFVALAEGREVIGWVQGGSSRDEDCRSASEIYAIYILPSHWQQGVGRCLMARIYEEFADCDETIVWVLDGNRRAIDFYMKLGYRPDGATKDIKTGSSVLTEMRMRRGSNQPAGGSGCSAESDTHI